MYLYAVFKQDNKECIMNEIEQAMMGGIVFKGSKSDEYAKNDENKVKTKAKKATRIKGLHNSDSSKMKAEIRRKRAARKSQQKNR